MNFFVIIAQFLCEKWNYKIEFVVVQRFPITFNACALCGQITVPNYAKWRTFIENQRTIRVWFIVTEMNNRCDSWIFWNYHLLSVWYWWWNKMNFTKNYSQLAMAVSHYSSQNDIWPAKATDTMDIARAFILSVLVLYGFEGFGAWTLVSFISRNIALEIFGKKNSPSVEGVGFMSNYHKNFN